MIKIKHFGLLIEDTKKEQGETELCKTFEKWLYGIETDRRILSVNFGQRAKPIFKWDNKYNYLTELYLDVLYEDK